MITAAADGSALGNPGPAGWAWYVSDDCWAAGGWKHGTNNMGELMAVLDLLRATAHRGDEELLVLCDSQYAINVISKWTPGWKRKGWKKADGKPVMNVDLVKALDEAMAGRKVRFEWVKGHAGHQLNEAADARARGAALAYQQGVEPDVGPGFAGDMRGSGAYADEPEDSGASEDPEEFQADVAEADAQDALFDLGTPAADTDIVCDLERSLLTDAVRSDPARVAALLHEDWFEIGASGRLWSRAEMLAEIGPLSTAVECVILRVSVIARDEILVLWRAAGAEGSTLRTSLWVRVSGHWRQRFHQGTPEA